MRNFKKLWTNLAALAGALLLITACGAAVAFARSHPQSEAQSDAPHAALNPSVPPGAHIDPSHVTYKWPSQIDWRGRPGGQQMATLVGDSRKPGFYIVLMKFFPHQMSHPHFHKYDRYATVLSGTWWVGTGTKFEPDKMVPMPAGSFVTDLAGKVHYDGAKDVPVVLEICGQGPVTMTSAETK
ncbi:MAG: cupin domain-containing protein [Candidatus Acidiferrales bacterium]